MRDNEQHIEDELDMVLAEAFRASPMGAEDAALQCIARDLQLVFRDTPNVAGVLTWPTPSDALAYADRIARPRNASESAGSPIPYGFRG